MGLREAAFAARVLHRTRLLGALTARGLWSFAGAARGQRPGPHLAVTLHASNEPEKIAVVDGPRRIPYAAFDFEANQLAHALVALGVTPGDRVALLLPNRAEFLVAQQAVTRLGGLCVQIGTRLRAGEIEYVLADARPTALIVDEALLGEAEQARTRAGAPASHAVIVTGDGTRPLAVGERYAAAIARQRGDVPPRARPDAGGVIIYTSGTTGKPKGATRRLRDTGLEAVLDLMATVELRHDDRHLTVCPLYHSAAPAFVQMMLLLGGSVHLHEHFDAEAVLATIARERITCAFMVPTQLARLADLPPAVRARHDTSSLRWILSGGAPLAPDVARRFQDAFGPVLWNFYGATETGVVTLAGPDDHGRRPGTIGRALRGNDIRLYDEAGRPVPAGEIGELYVRNAMLIAGYHGNEAATRAAMRDGYFSVGDLARRDPDGFYYLEARRHDMVISGGVNIYPREIEDHLHAHPDVAEAAVVGRADPEWGESLVAFVVRRPGARLDAAGVIAHCRKALAGYKAPREVRFVDALPRTPTGKVLKRALRSRR